MTQKDKEEAVQLLDKQLDVEKRLIEVYEETRPFLTSEAAGWLLHMLQMDSRKHIAALTLAREVIQGRKIGYPTRQEAATGLEKHIELEKESVERAKKLMANPVIKANPGLGRLIASWADDEARHHKMLQRLKDEKYAPVDPLDAYTQYRRDALAHLANEIKKLLE